METVLIIAAVTAGNALCFLLGARRPAQQTDALQTRPVSGIRKLLQPGRKKNAPAVDPMDVIMANLENYDGTANGQKDIPRG